MQYIIYYKKILSIRDGVLEQIGGLMHVLVFFYLGLECFYYRVIK